MSTRDFQRPDYTYRVTVDRVIDGDTVDVVIDVGFKTTVFKRLRLLGDGQVDLDTEELRDKDPERRARAKASKARLQEILIDSEPDRVYAQTVLDSTGKYGRLLAWLWVEREGDLTNVNIQMMTEGHQKKPR